MKKSELFVITKAKELCSYVLAVTDKSPKKFRFTLVSRMQNLSLNVLEYLFRANDVYVGDGAEPGKWKERAEWQQRAVTDLRLLDYIAMVAMEQNCILRKQYQQIARLSTDTLALAVRWRKASIPG